MALIVTLVRQFVELSQNQAGLRQYQQPEFFKLLNVKTSQVHKRTAAFQCSRSSQSSSAFRD